MVRLSAEEFLRRWVQHVLPRGFVKIRHYGLLANRGQGERLRLCRTLLGLWQVVPVLLTLLGAGDDSVGVSRRCESCGCAEWVLVGEVPRCPPGVGIGVTESASAPDTSLWEVLGHSFRRKSR